MVLWVRVVVAVVEVVLYTPAALDSGDPSVIGSLAMSRTAHGGST